MSMLCNNNRVCWVIFHFIKLLHSKHLSSFLQNFSMRCFRCGKKKTPYRSPFPGASITILPLSQLRLVSFYSVLFFIFFIFIFTIMFSSSKLQYSGLYFPFIYEGTKMCLNFKFCEKRGNTDLRAGAKLTT